MAAYKRPKMRTLCYERAYRTFRTPHYAEVKSADINYSTAYFVKTVATISMPWKLVLNMYFMTGYLDNLYY